MSSFSRSAETEACLPTAPPPPPPQILPQRKNNSHSPVRIERLTKSFLLSLAAQQAVRLPLAPDDGGHRHRRADGRVARRDQRCAGRGLRIEEGDAAHSRGGHFTVRESCRPFRCKIINITNIDTTIDTTIVVVSFSWETVGLVVISFACVRCLLFDNVFFSPLVSLGGESSFWGMCGSRVTTPICQMLSSSRHQHHRHHHRPLVSRVVSEIISVHFFSCGEMFHRLLFSVSSLLL